MVLVLLSSKLVLLDSISFTPLRLAALNIIDQQLRKIYIKGIQFLPFFLSFVALNSHERVCELSVLSML